MQRRIDLKRELAELKKRAEGTFAATGRPAASRRSSVRLDEAAAGEETSAGGGVFYRIVTDAASVWTDAATFHREYLEALGGPFFPPAPQLEPLRPLIGASPERILYLDIETTGLSGSSPLFLVGLMHTTRGRLIVEQLFARDYEEEAAVLAFLRPLAAGFGVLVTFNGATFDVPYIRERAAFHRLAFSAPAVHVDLLPVSRALLGPRTPNHRLQTLEAHLCGRKRVGDIGGADIPGAYHEFVRTGNAKDVGAVIHHNRLDLVTMLQLVTLYLAGGF